MKHSIALIIQGALAVILVFAPYAYNTIRVTLLAIICFIAGMMAQHGFNILS